jgi:hypothetical protein
MDPLFPLVLAPVLMMMTPLTPETPESAVVITRLPLDEALPLPVLMIIDPPEADAEAPAVKET